MNVKWKTVVLAVAASVTSAAAAGDGWAAGTDVVVPERDRVCMVEDKVTAAPAAPVTLDGKTYYVQCEMCKQRMAAEPGQYARLTDPVSEKPVDKATAALLSVDGRVLYFETRANRDRFAADPSKYRTAENGR
jgi:YHS domain-containing protein